METFQPSIIYYASEVGVTIKIEDLSTVELVLGKEVVVLEDAIDEYLRLKAEEKKAEELVEEYRKEEIEEALADAPLDDPTHHSWDRYLKLANHEPA